ncbi:uncharacterized protein BHQ10_000391 [Talaromyces amestolkiae]|uniref:Uncharacterized protein n=1 Tax=Talaromyces amestolkiae TaxID=1196081 RepID=A0A364KLF9_TALAM|nr:uncharacterized protein BHQ10_000391 [Talaromyces amestolkiae]RAO64379.1 hypothetical protein BHQ10_000391 [Talaromyces amestolkiae]
MDGPPPPPPPHGANPNTTEGTPRYRKSTDLPDGPYDIFVIPPHSAGGGFIYLPSLNCHRNSFIAGSLSTLAIVVLWIQLQPLVKTWLAAMSKSNAPGGMGVILLVVAVGFAGWYFGTLQNDAGGMNGNSSGRPRPGAGFANGFQYGGAQPNPGASYPGGGPAPNGQYNNTGGQYNPGGASQPPPFNNHSAQPNGAAQDDTQDNTPKNAQNSTPKEDPKKAEAEWERAREETRRKEEIRRKMEAYKKKREAEEAERRRQQEREAMEKELKQRKEELEREAAAAKAAAEKEIRERAAREEAERAERVRREAEEREEKARKEAAEKEAAAKEAAKKEAAARFAAAKEAAAKKFAAAKEAAAKAKEASKAPPPSAAPAPSAASAPPRTPSPKKPPPPSARTADVDDDAYSFRPYDRPRRPYGTSAPSVYSESSYAPSQSTARTTPPPSHRGPYMTKDPDKVIIRGVYLFNNAFQKTPIAQLVSGQGSVTDGLVLRITTEGLFVDDDVRGVAQREWDVKAWTLKSVETIKLRGLQVVRASVRDQEGKRYVFVLTEAEVWKVTQGFKKLKSGSQARHLSQSELSKNEANTYLTNLGY